MHLSAAWFLHQEILAIFVIIKVTRRVQSHSSDGPGKSVEDGAAAGFARNQAAGLFSFNS